MKLCPCCCLKSYICLWYCLIQTTSFCFHSVRCKTVAFEPAVPTLLHLIRGCGIEALLCVYYTKPFSKATLGPYHCSRNLCLQECKISSCPMHGWRCVCIIFCGWKQLHEGVVGRVTGLPPCGGSRDQKILKTEATHAVIRACFCDWMFTQTRLYQTQSSRCLFSSA